LSRQQHAVARYNCATALWPPALGRAAKQSVGKLSLPTSSGWPDSVTPSRKFEVKHFNSRKLRVALPYIIEKNKGKLFMA